MPLQLASDDFNRANEIPIVGAGWLTTTGATSLQVTSDFVSCVSLGGALNYQYFNGGIVWPNDQYSQIQLTTNNKNANTNSGAIIRNSATVDTMYNAQIVNGNLVIGKTVSGSFTQLASVAYVFTNGDIMYFEAIGTTLNVKMNGVQKATATDSAIASGFPGIFMLTSTGMTANVNSDNWSGGASNLTSHATQAWGIVV